MQVGGKKKVKIAHCSSSTASYRNISTCCRNKLIHLIKYNLSLNTGQSNLVALNIICEILKKMPNEAKMAIDLYRAIVSLFHRLQCDTSREYLNFLQFTAESTPELRYIVLVDIANYHIKRGDLSRLVKDVKKHFVDWKLEGHEDAILLTYLARYHSLVANKNCGNGKVEIPSDIRNGIRRIFKVYMRYKRIPSALAFQVFTESNYIKDPDKCMSVVDEFINLFPKIPHIRLVKYNLVLNSFKDHSYVGSSSETGSMPENSDISCTKCSKLDKRMVNEGYNLLFNCYSPSVENLKIVVQNIECSVHKMDIYCKFLLKNLKCDYAWVQLSNAILNNPLDAAKMEQFSMLKHYYHLDTNIMRAIGSDCLIDYLITGIVASAEIEELLDEIQQKASVKFGFGKLTIKSDYINHQSKINDLWKLIHGNDCPSFFSELFNNSKSLS